jgi:hypothetical protein
MTMPGCSASLRPNSTGAWLECGFQQNLIPAYWFVRSGRISPVTSVLTGWPSNVSGIPAGAAALLSMTLMHGVFSSGSKPTYTPTTPGLAINSAECAFKTALISGRSGFDEFMPDWQAVKTKNAPVARSVLKFRMTTVYWPTIVAVPPSCPPRKVRTSSMGFAMATCELPA